MTLKPPGFGRPRPASSTDEAIYRARVDTTHTGSWCSNCQRPEREHTVRQRRKCREATA